MSSLHAPATRKPDYYVHSRKVAAASQVPVLTYRCYDNALDRAYHTRTGIRFNAIPDQFVTIGRVYLKPGVDSK